MILPNCTIVYISIVLILTVFKKASKVASKSSFDICPRAIIVDKGFAPILSHYDLSVRFFLSVLFCHYLGGATSVADEAAMSDLNEK